MKRAINFLAILLFAFTATFGFQVNTANASTIQAGSLRLNSPGPLVLSNGDTSSFTTVTFPTPFPEGSDVIVIPMVQTFNGADTPGVRIADVTTTGFKFKMNELVRGGPRQVLSDGEHTTETIGWVAFSI